ncbi:MAG: MFS transporter, partial [Aestuariibacter sp.]|nr:MFS transporter [Aestuariibacter sp.]
MTTTSANRRTLVAACAAITVFGFAFGMTYPLLSLILESRGVPSDMIGINSAMMPLGILLFSSVIPVATKRFGARNVAICAALASGFIMLGYKVFDNLAAWFLIRLLQGMSISTLFVLSES